MDQLAALPTYEAQRIDLEEHLADVMADMAAGEGEVTCVEEVLGEKSFFSGDELGFLDVVLVPFSCMFRGYERHGGFDLEVECPRLMRWVQRCKERESVRSDEEMYQLHKKWYGIE